MSAQGRTVPGLPDRVAYVDGLRGVAALSVLATHATAWVRPSLGPANPLAFVFRLGVYGVDLFFVLSGFCLAFPFLRGRGEIDLARFASRRLVRIIPPYYAAIALFALALWAGPSPFIHYVFPPQDGWRLLAQALFLDRNPHYLSSPFWTLAIELRWYAMFPLALWLWMASPRAFAVVGVAAIVAFRWTTAGAADLYALPAFMLGIVAADAVVRRSIPSRTAWTVLAVLCAVTLPLEWFVGPSKFDPPLRELDVRDYLPPQRTLWQFVAFAGVLAAGVSTLAQRILAWRSLALCGRASYSIYLVHLPVVIALRTGGVEPSGSWTEAGVLAAAGLGAGLLFWRLIEYPVTETALKTRLLACVEPAVVRAFAWLRLPQALPLGAGVQAGVASPARASIGSAASSA